MRYQRTFLALSLLAAAGVSNADIFILAGPGNFDNDENILFNVDGLEDNGNPVQGITNDTGFIVDFLGTEDLTTPSSGQARVEAMDGSFDNLSIFLDDPDAGYTSLILNINAQEDGLVDFDVTGLDGSHFFQSFSLDGGGENFFRIFSTDDDFITNTFFATNVGLHDIRQVRIGGSTTEFPPEGEPLPEPATVGFACAAVGMAFLRRTKKRAS